MRSNYVTVTVIVPNYNHSLFLRERLESVFNQTFQDFEVILLDDCSTDNSVEILTEYSLRPQVSHFIINEQNSGSPFAQWQKGLALASGEYIWIAESDDMADPKFLEIMIGFLNEKVGIAFCTPTEINYKSEIKETPKSEERNEFKLQVEFQKSGLEKIADGFMYKNLIYNASTCVFKKTLAYPFPGVIKNFKYAGDWYFWITIVEKTVIHYHNISLSYFRSHQNSSRTTKNILSELKRIRECTACIKLATEILEKHNIKYKINYSKYTWLYKAIHEKKRALSFFYLMPPLPLHILYHFYINRILNFLKIIS